MISVRDFTVFLFFFFILLAFGFNLVFSTIFQEPNTQKSLHNTADKDVTKIRKV